MVETLVVDGYNVLTAFAKAGLIDAENIDRARFQLLNLLLSCAAFWSMDLVIVFDAMHVRGGIEREEKIGPRAKVIFSGEGVSADTVIESLIGRGTGRGRMIVATSDRAEQEYIFGKGAIRWPARELVKRVSDTRAGMSDSAATSSAVGTLHERVNPGVLAVLNQLRLGSMPADRKKSQKAGKP